MLQLCSGIKWSLDDINIESNAVIKMTVDLNNEINNEIKDEIKDDIKIVNC